MLEWFSPLAWWRMKLKQILDIVRQRGISEDLIGELVSIVIIHQPYLMEQGQLWSRNEAQIWGTFEAYSLEESYRNQPARHLCEVNN